MSARGPAGTVALAFALAAALPARAEPGGAALEAAVLPAPLPTDPAAPLWEKIPAAVLVASPQRSLRLHDREANQALAAAGPREVRVRAATDGTALAVLLEWADPGEDRSRPDATDAFGDAAALQVPLRSGAGQRLPYVGMGDAEQPVAIWMARATSDGVAVREAVGHGFGTLTRSDLGGVRAAMRRDPVAATWRALFVRPLLAGGIDLRRGLLPFAVAVWDGARRERGGNKALTGWTLLRLPAYPADPAVAALVAAGPPGDVAHGQELFQAVCAMCHRVGPDAAAPPGLAPDLSAVGAIATPGYLRQSIQEPSAVLVPSPNPRQHQERSAKGVGAWPVDEGFAWHRSADGKPTSAMPDYASMPPEEVAALVAYLGTLGVPGRGRTP